MVRRLFPNTETDYMHIYRDQATLHIIVWSAAWQRAHAYGCFYSVHCQQFFSLSSVLVAEMEQVGLVNHFLESKSLSWPLYVVINVIGAVENFLTECSRTEPPMEEAERDYMTTRLEAVSSNIEEVMQYVGIDPRLTQLRYRIRQHIQRLQPFATLCTQPVIGIHTTTQVR